LGWSLRGNFNGKVDGKGSAGIPRAFLDGSAVTKDGAAIFGNHSITDEQSQTGAIPYFLGGEEGVEDLIHKLSRNPTAVILYYDLHMAVLFAELGRDGDCSRSL